jgi:hypothetical protein
MHPFVARGFPFAGQQDTCGLALYATVELKSDAEAGGVPGGEFSQL